MRSKDNDIDVLSDLNAFWAAKEVQIYTTMPGEIVEYDAEKRSATVVLGIQMGIRQEDGTLQNKDRPIIYQCPVVFPTGGGATITWPLVKGDKVMVHFSMRCMDDWLDTGQRLPPRFRWKHDINDAIVVPGLTPWKEVQPAATDGLVLEHESGIKIRLTSAGKVAIEKGGVELLDIVDKLIDRANELANAKTATVFGNITSIEGPVISQALVAPLTGLKSLLANLKE